MQSHIEFLLVRHGETISNSQGILQGQVDGELNKIGLLQAAAIAERLHGVHLDACYSSDLHRAAATAKIILTAGHKGVPLHLDEGLREWNLGVLEGKKQQDLLRDYPEIMRSFRFEGGRELLVPDGESSTQFQSRIEECLARIAAKHTAGERLLLVTHGAALSRILQAVVGRFHEGVRTPIVANASISSIWYLPQDNAWELISWNETSHLKDLPTHETLVY